MVMTLTLTKTQIRGFLRILPRDDINPAVCTCLHVDAMRRVVVATDSRILLAWAPEEDALTGNGEALIPRALLARAEKAMGRKDCVHVAVDEAGALRMQAGDVALAGQCARAQFPDWRVVVPRKFSGEPAVLNPEYVYRAGIALDEVLGTKPGQPRPVQYSGPNMPAALVESRAFALIMPVRFDDDQLPALDYELFGIEGAAASGEGA